MLAVLPTFTARIVPSRIDAEALSATLRPAGSVATYGVLLRPQAGTRADSDGSASTVSALGPADLLPGPMALDEELERSRPSADVGEVVAVPASATGDNVFHLIGTGDGSPQSLRRAGAAWGRRLRETRSAVVLAAGLSADGVAALVEGIGLASYAFALKSKPRNPNLSELVVVNDEPETEQALSRAVVTVRAVRQARDLINTPAATASPEAIAQYALTTAPTGLDVQVRDESSLAAEGWGGVLAVGSGSALPPRVIEMSYRPRGSSRLPHVVLVGKGITFDTGGLSLKRPHEAMVSMKTDMAGSAVVIAVMHALAELRLPLRVTGLAVLAENMPSGSAARPGDVLTTFGGTTVEVRNTDAEGRLVLADALSYADRFLKLDVIVDLATLTGAASLGLGRRHAALFSNDDQVAAGLLAAAEESGERAWRLPLVEDYASALRSEVADLCHISTDPHISGGAITAALFLREFVGGRPWAHLDIAGPARADADEHEITRGGTGFGVRTLLRWLAVRAA